MDQTKELVKTIVEGLQEKRGKNIVTVDLSQTSGAICQYMVICEGNTPTQVSALSDSLSVPLWGTKCYRPARLQQATAPRISLNTLKYY